MNLNQKLSEKGSVSHIPIYLPDDHKEPEDETDQALIKEREIDEEITNLRRTAGYTNKILRQKLALE